MKINEKKICILPAWYPTEEDSVAGIFIKEQAEALSEAGAIVSVLYFHKIHSKKHSPRQYYIKNSGVHQFIKKGVALPKLTSGLINRWAAEYDSLMETHIDKIGLPDIFHSHSYIGGFVGRRLSIKYNRPLIHTEHSTNFISGGIRHWHKKEIRLLFEHSQTLIAVGKVLKEKMQQFINREIIVIPNMVNEKVFYYDKNVAKEDFTFIVVGGLEERKQVHLIIKAFSLLNLSKTNLKIVGDGNELSRLQKLTHKLNLGKRILFTGAINLTEVAEQMRNSTALVTMSKTETFGKVIIEALASGIPVISHNNADPEKIITPKSGILLKDKRLLTKKMKELIDGLKNYNGSEISKSTFFKFGKTAFLKKIENIYTF